MKTAIGLLFCCFFLMFGETLSGVEIEQKLIVTTFENDAHDWYAERFCKATLNPQEKFLSVRAVDGLPHFSRSLNILGGEIHVVLEIRTTTVSELSTFWTTQGSPRRSDDKMLTRTLIPDGVWHSYEFVFPIPDRLINFTLRFNVSEGNWDIKSFTVFRRRVHPLSIKQITLYQPTDNSSDQPLDQPSDRTDGNKPENKINETTIETNAEPKMFRCTIFNDLSVPLTFQVGEQPEEFRIPGSRSIDLGVPIKAEGNLAAAHLQLFPKEFPEINFSFFQYRPEGKTNWISKPLNSSNNTGTNTKIFEIAPNARMARIRQDKNIVAIIAPIVHRNGMIPAFELSADSAKNLLHFQAPDTELTIQFDGGNIRFLIEDKTVTNSQTAPQLLEGPVVRVLGKLQSGLLPGVEFLGQGDVSSSDVDIEPPHNDRSEPNPLWITLPIAVIGTDLGTAMLRWNDPKLQPRFASPNHFDYTDDHRMSLVGTKIDATLELLIVPASPDNLVTGKRQTENSADGDSVTVDSAAVQALRRYVSIQGFPKPPDAPRTSEEQRLLNLRALYGAVQADDDLRWGYAAESDWQRQPFADMFSTIVRLTETETNLNVWQPRPTGLIPGGSDIANDIIYFLTERVEEWKASRENVVQSILSLRNPDGSFLHRTHFPEVESASTSFGYTAIRTLEIMEYVRLVGSRELFEKIKPSLDYLKQCDVPSGGFYRDTPLHTPDLATSAALTWLYTWAFEFTGNSEYLERAKYSALTGLPFVYLWNNEHIPIYITVSKFGASRRQLPTSFGVSQTRVGIIYAYALNLLAEYDSDFDWKRIAAGILHALEKIQYTGEVDAGCIPDTFNAVTKIRSSWKVNPCALVSLRFAVEGRTDSFFVLTNENKTERYVSPYPLRLTPQGIEAVDVPPGRKFQILHNGSRIGNAEGPGLVTID